MQGEKSFKYKNLKFFPLRKFEVHETFVYVSKKLDFIGIHNNPSIDKGVVRNWDYDDFYKAAGQSCAEIDVFLFEGKQVVPCKGQLYGYDN